LRALAQKCPQGMKSLITFGGQHQGIYGSLVYNISLFILAR
jgi:hypothetical protein